MIERSKCMNVPEIRFNDSLSEWSKKNFLSEVSIYSGLTYSPNDIRTQGTLVLRSSNVQEGNVSLNDNVYVNSFIVNSPNVQKGDIIIVVRNGSQSLIGKHAIIKQEMPNTVIGAFMTGLHCKNNSNFINALLSSTKFKKEIYKNLGATINQITNKTLTSMEFMFPKENDMYNIGCFFEKLDSLIQTISKKLASLKQIKAASLQSMFPQEETVPKVRFKGFEGEWKKIQLNKCLDISNNINIHNTYGINDVLSISDEAGVVNQIEFLGRSFAGKSLQKYKILKTNQLVYTKSPLKAKPYGIIKKNFNRTGIVSTLYAIYDCKDNVSSEFIHYYFDPCYRINQYLSPLVNKGAKNTMNISDETALSGEIWIPSLQEQQKIASYFCNLDRQISLQTQRLEKLKQIKAACLDKMFV